MKMDNLRSVDNNVPVGNRCVPEMHLKYPGVSEERTGGYVAIIGDDFVCRRSSLGARAEISGADKKK